MSPERQTETRRTILGGVVGMARSLPTRPIAAIPLSACGRRRKGYLATGATSMPRVQLILFVADVPTTALQTYMFGGLDNFPLLAVPFFILAGEIMGRGGIARRVVAWVISIVGGVRGSLAITTVASSELFGAIAHSSVGTVAAVGRLLYPSLKSNGYGETFSASMIASSGGVAIVIPPSISMILYAMSAQQSAVLLFTAGILPSLLIGLIDASYVLVHAHIKMVPLTSRARWENIWATTKEAIWSIGTLVVIFGGIYGGVFTPTEAAGVAVVYSLFVTMVIHRDISWADLWQITSPRGCGNVLNSANAVCL